MKIDDLSSPPSIYLAGGFHSGWQQSVRGKLHGWTVFDPSLNGLRSAKDYTQWDLEAIKSSDIVLAYMEASNPGGYALALEIGYASALEKPIIFVDLLLESHRSKYFEMIRQVVDQTFNSLDEAVKFLLSDAGLQLVKQAA